MAISLADQSGTNAASSPARRMRSSARAPLHWVEFLLEGVELATFMLSACLVVAAIEYPGSPLRPLLPNAVLRRFVIGCCMGLTAVGLIYSGWGKRSGAHMNPALTLTFYRLGKIKARDALGYALAQFIGASAGVLLAHVLLGDILADPTVNFVATSPGSAGSAWAFLAELGISALLMLVVLITSSEPRLEPYTGCFAGILITLYITFVAPVSGMSMNPARTLGSALWAGNFQGLWLYFVAPTLGMLLAAELYTRLGARRPVPCAKLRHDLRRPCIFCGSVPVGRAPAAH